MSDKIRWNMKDLLKHTPWKSEKQTVRKIKYEAFPAHKTGGKRSSWYFYQSEVDLWFKRLESGGRRAS